MTTIGNETTADLFFQINWTSDRVHHTDAYSGKSVNMWRDILPRRLYDGIMGTRTGDQIQFEIEANALLPPEAQADALTVQKAQFDASALLGRSLLPRQGRFYPKGLLNGVPGIFRANREPFRCVNINNGSLGAEMGHPLSGRTIEVHVTVGSVRSKLMERGGSLRHWGEQITHGVGMQARWQGVPTDFFSDDPFRRVDETPDPIFYNTPRMVQHIDDAAISMVQQMYGRFLKPGMRVLDLMSSWQTHLPAGIRPLHVTGLGLNEAELKRNPNLNTVTVHDLNTTPALPYDDGAFDVVLCNASIEYLIHPSKVVQDVARVLVPGGAFVITFSNRWFEPKTIRLWPQLHEFERMGLVLEYLRSAAAFNDLHTYSIRGLDRPPHDKYFGTVPYADPVYAVWGTRS